MAKRKSYFFLTNEDALVFTARVNSRVEALRHYERALARTDLEDADVAFLSREAERLRAEINAIKTAA